VPKRKETYRLTAASVYSPEPGTVIYARDWWTYMLHRVPKKWTKMFGHIFYQTQSVLIKFDTYRPE